MAATCFLLCSFQYAHTCRRADKWGLVCLSTQSTGLVGRAHIRPDGSKPAVPHTLCAHLLPYKSRVNCSVLKTSAHRVLCNNNKKKKQYVCTPAGMWTNLCFQLFLCFSSEPCKPENVWQLLTFISSLTCAHILDVYVLQICLMHSWEKETGRCIFHWCGQEWSCALLLILKKSLCTVKNNQKKGFKMYPV